jgi:hypothetical protein
LVIATAAEREKEINKLRDAGVPAEWAIIAAARMDSNHDDIKRGDFSLWLEGAFVWANSPEGHEYWASAADGWYDEWRAKRRGNH